MSDVIVIGDGPGGLSAALFLARGAVSVTIYGQDKTAMHWAMLENYLGVDKLHGSEFQKIARGQVTRFGATIEDARVESVEKTDDGFKVTLEGGATATCRYLILGEGKSPRLAKQLGLEHDAEQGLSVNRDGLTSVTNLYAIGRLVRPGRSQAIISAGDGAAAAIDILSREKGAAYCDWDSPPEEG